jgi:DNA-binding IclR family transcriptional regulator
MPVAQTLRRGMSILRLLARSTASGLGVSDIGRRLSLSKATAVRLTQTLAEEAFVVQDHSTRRYRLGPAAFAIGIAAEPNYAIQRLAAPAIRALALDSGDSTCFSIRQGMEVVCLSVEKGAAFLPEPTLRVGDRYPLGVSSAGLAILAALPDTEVQDALELHGSHIDRTYPGSTVGVIQALIKDTRERGYALVAGLLLPGYWALGVPLMDSGGRPIAAITLVAMESRMGFTRRAVLGERMRRISCDLMDMAASTLEQIPIAPSIGQVASAM